MSASCDHVRHKIVLTLLVVVTLLVVLHVGKISQSLLERVAKKFCSLLLWYCRAQVKFVEHLTKEQQPNNDEERIERKLIKRKLKKI